MSDDLLNLSLKDFLAATAAKVPAPGGGAVAALTGALAASLAVMALEYTVGKKSFAAHDADIRANLAALQTASTLFQDLVGEDAAAYEALGPLLKLSPEARAGNPDFLPAVVAAIRAPQTVAAIAADILHRCEFLLDKTNKHLLSDLGIAATLAHAALHASELNVRINLPLLPSADEAATLKQALSTLTQKADKTYDKIRVFMLEKI